LSAIRRKKVEFQIVCRTLFAGCVPDCREDQVQLLCLLPKWTGWSLAGWGSSSDHAEPILGFQGFFAADPDLVAKSRFDSALLGAAVVSALFSIAFSRSFVCHL
jgi:hypothetical protein